MKSTFSILFYTDRSKTNEHGLCVIRCRITCNGTSSSFSTQLQTSPDEWLARKGRIKATADNSSGIWKSHTNLTHPGKYFRPSKVKIMRPTSPK